MRTNPVLEVLLKSRGGISKLGPDVYHWSLPPGLTCPGQSDVCRKICYAKGICGRYPEVDPAWTRNLKLSERADFAELLKTALIALQHREKNAAGKVLLRIHVGGDFYSPAYIQAWGYAIAFANLVDSVPVVPWAYTRIWRVPWLVSSLHGKWPEWLWCSTDPSTENPCQWVNEARMIAYPTNRNKLAMAGWRDGLAENKLTCPHIAAKFRGDPNPPTCQDCGRCWYPKKIAPGRLGRGHVLLIPQHR